MQYCCAKSVNHGYRHTSVYVCLVPSLLPTEDTAATQRSFAVCSLNHGALCPTVALSSRSEDTAASLRSCARCGHSSTKRTPQDTERISELAAATSHVLICDRSTAVRVCTVRTVVVRVILTRTRRGGGANIRVGNKRQCFIFQNCRIPPKGNVRRKTLLIFFCFWPHYKQKELQRTFLNESLFNPC